MSGGGEQVTDAMILYARHILGEPHLKSWYQQFGYQDQIGQVAMKGWQCLICEEVWTRTYTPDPKLQGSPPQVIRALFYSAISHHKEAHSRDAQELKASLPTGPLQPAPQTLEPSVGHDSLGSERGPPGAGEGQSPPHVDVASPPSPAEPCPHEHKASYKPFGEILYRFCKDCGERVG